MGLASFNRIRREQAAKAAAAASAPSSTETGNAGDQQPSAEDIKAWGEQNIATVLSRVSSGEITREHALLMEQARGDDARPTLIARLTEKVD